MDHENISAGFKIKNSQPILPASLKFANSFNKSNHIKTCKYRNANGFCTRTQQACPATLFIINFNN